MLFKGVVREVRTIDRFYIVEADSEDEAKEKLESGETIMEEDVDGIYEVINRHIQEPPLLDGGISCKKCGTPLKDGYCQDETCPYSDYLQNETYTVG